MNSFSRSLYYKFIDQISFQVFLFLKILSRFLGKTFSLEEKTFFLGRNFHEEGQKSEMAKLSALESLYP